MSENNHPTCFMSRDDRDQANLALSRAADGIMQARAAMSLELEGKLPGTVIRGWEELDRELRRLMRKADELRKQVDATPIE